MWWNWAIDILIWIAIIGLFWQAVSRWKGYNSFNLTNALMGHDKGNKKLKKKINSEYLNKESGRVKIKKRLVRGVAF